MESPDYGTTSPPPPPAGEIRRDPKKDPRPGDPAQRGGMESPDSGGATSPPPLPPGGITRDPKKDPRPGDPWRLLPRSTDYFPYPIGGGGGTAREMGVRLISTPTLSGPGLEALVLAVGKDTVYLLGLPS